MEIIEYSNNIGKLPPSVIALGFFDGVHVGHRALLRRAKEEAKELGLGFTVFTFFSESPGLKAGEGRLYSTEEKCELLAALGVDCAIVASFEELSGLSAEEFVKDVLVSRLSCRVAVTGEDFRFGKGASGDTDELSRLMTVCGGRAIRVSDEKIDGSKISTSMIKEMLSSGNVRGARELLGEPYHIDAKVEHGRGVGRTLGIPTVNNSLPTGNDFIAKGVYLSLVKIDGRSYTGLTNIGTCPTFEERPTHAETFILDFSGEIYEKKIRIYLIDYIREERRFSSERELALEIEKNVAFARGYRDLPTI